MPDVMSDPSVYIIITLSGIVIILIVIVILLADVGIRRLKEIARMKKEIIQLWQDIDQLTLDQCIPPVIPELDKHDEPSVRSSYLTVPGPWGREYETLDRNDNEYESIRPERVKDRTDKRPSSRVELKGGEVVYEIIGLEKKKGKDDADEGPSSRKEPEGRERREKVVGHVNECSSPAKEREIGAQEE